MTVPGRSCTPFSAMASMARLRINGQRGRRTNAIGWMCFEQSLCEPQVVVLGPRRVHPGSRGCRFSGDIQDSSWQCLPKSTLKRDYPIHVQGRAFTVEDLVEAEMQSCSARAGTDLQADRTIPLPPIRQYVEGRKRPGMGSVKAVGD